MGFRKSISFNDAERKRLEILVVEPDASNRANFRQALIAQGYAKVSEANDHVSGIDRVRNRPVTHILFDAKATNMSPQDFVVQALEWDPKLTLVPASLEPTVDDVFGLLVLGARGYVVKPFTPETLDVALLMATKGEAISPAILYAKDRNEALASFVLTALDKVAVLTCDARKHETARPELRVAEYHLKRAVDIARTFMKGTEDDLREAFIEFCVERASGPATKLGRLRKRLETRKAALQNEIEEAIGKKSS